MFLIRKARKLARKWGGQCIIFIDEIDAVGLRRQALGGGGAGHAAAASPTSSDHAFYGPWGALTGDRRPDPRDARVARAAVRQPRAGRRAGLPAGARATSTAGSTTSSSPAAWAAWAAGMALNQLLVQMDGVDEPPFWRKFWTNRINTFLDASYIVPRKLGRLLAAPAARRKPRAGAGLLHRRDQRPDRPARPGADPPGPHGPPHLVPHADQGRPQATSSTSTSARSPTTPDLDTRQAPRRAGAHHERVLAGDDRAGLLDGADLRALRRARRRSSGTTSSRR